VKGGSRVAGDSVETDHQFIILDVCNREIFILWHAICESSLTHIGTGSSYVFIQPMEIFFCFGPRKVLESSNGNESFAISKNSTALSDSKGLITLESKRNSRFF